jgi:MraZ protein
MNFLTGRFQHTLDGKGRLVLPAKFRTEFQNGGWVAPEKGRSLSMYTVGEFTRRAEEFRALSHSDDEADRRRSLYWSSNSTEVEVDRQGRFALPASIRDIARLDGEVLFIGHLDHLEIWNPELFDTYASSGGEYFTLGSGA